MEKDYEKLLGFPEFDDLNDVDYGDANEDDDDELERIILINKNEIIFERIQKPLPTNFSNFMFRKKNFKKINYLIKFFFFFKLKIEKINMEYLFLHFLHLKKTLTQIRKFFF